MKKERLLNMRLKYGLTQQQMADKLNITVSTYNRKEGGHVKIRKEEWAKISEVLEVQLEEIYQGEERHFFIPQDHAKGNSLCNSQNYTILQSIFFVQQKYIAQLEAEIERLKKSKSCSES